MQQKTPNGQAALFPQPAPTGPYPEVLPVAKAAAQTPPVNGQPKALSTILEGAKRAEVDAYLIHTPPGNPEPTLDEVRQSGLLENIEQHGLLVELILYPRLDMSGHFYAADGNHRAVCLRELRRKARAIILAKAATEDDLDTLRVCLASTGKKVDKGQIGLNMFTWWKRVPGRTERDAAEHFSKSTSYTNKLLAPFKNGIPELVDALLARRIAPTAVPFVASHPHEVQREILPKVLGKKRAAVQAICEQYKERKAKSGGEPFKATVGGVTLSMKESAPERRLDRLKALWARLGEVLKQAEEDPRMVPAIAKLLAG